MSLLLGEGCKNTGDKYALIRWQINLTTVSELRNTLKIIVNLYGSLYLIDELNYMKLKYPIFALFRIQLHLVLVHSLLCSLDMILYPICLELHGRTLLFF